MKRIITAAAAVIAAAFPLFAQTDAQTAVAAAAAALTEADEVPAPAPKPKYWKTSILNNINFGQTSLSNWAAGGSNTYSMAANVDANANYAKDKMIWTNRLQLDFGFMYSNDKPIMQKTKDRLYFESKWGYETTVVNLAWSAAFEFKTQLGTNYDYCTPKDYAGDEPTRQEWLDARVLKSGFMSPAYTNLGIGVLWTPAPWLAVNISPLTGGFVVVRDAELRETYGMDAITDSAGSITGYKSSRFELGAQIKADAKWVINDNFSYTTQLALFSNYLDKPWQPRVNWDNKVFWKVAKYFALTVGSNMIYDPKVLVRDTTGDGTADASGIQLKEFFEFGFTYTLGG